MRLIMKNIEKYYYAITDNLKSKSGENLGCSVFSIRHGNDYCGDTDCLECCLKNLEWLNSEYKCHVLTDDEKDIIKPMIDTILKFGCSIICVAKEYYVDGSFYISISYKNDVIGHKECINSPCLNNDKFKGMEPEKGYTLEELGISCQTQKGN